MEKKFNLYDLLGFGIPGAIFLFIIYGIGRELELVPVIHTGRLITNFRIPEKSFFGNICEGYVVRNIEAFHISDFARNVAKCVRENHVQTDEHWTKNWQPNKLRKI